jgi:DHA2 family multidrug resistance protein
VHANLTTYVTPFNTALQMPDVASKIDLATDAGRALMDQIVTQQAAIIAYGNDFRLLMWIAIAAMPFVFLVGAAPRKQAPGPKDEPVHVMD